MGKKWVTLYLLTLGGLAVLAFYTATQNATLPFLPVTGETIVDLLTPLFVISLFLERAQEVIVSSWRGFARQQKQNLIEEKTNAREIAIKKPDAEAAQNLTNEILGAKHDLFDFRTKTSRLSFLLGLGVGILIAIVGVRILLPLVDIAGLGINSMQLKIFTFIDVLLTGAVLGGGSDGIHKLIVVITDFLESTRIQINKAATK
jgi:hypothetical protein